MQILFSFVCDAQNLYLERFSFTQFEFAYSEITNSFRCFERFMLRLSAVDFFIRLLFCSFFRTTMLFHTQPEEYEIKRNQNKNPRFEMNIRLNIKAKDVFTVYTKQVRWAFFSHILPFFVFIILPCLPLCLWFYIQLEKDHKQKVGSFFWPYFQTQKFDLST